MEFENVTVLLPVMDETYSLRETVDIILVENDIKYISEIVFLICDRTTVESRCVIDDLIKKYDFSCFKIHIQKMPYVGGAFREGFLVSRGTHIVMMSSDLETDPHLVKQFIELSKTNPKSIITASRWQDGGGFYQYNRVKLVCNFIFEKLIAILYGAKLTDMTYAYRLFPAELVKQIIWTEYKHPFFLETALKPLRLGVDFIEIPAYWRARTEGVSQNSFWANFRYFKTAWKIRFMNKDDILKV